MNVKKGDATTKSKQSPNDNTKINGHIYLNVDCDCDFAPFYPPKQASLKKYSLKDIDRKFEPTFQFISNNHLIMDCLSTFRLHGYSLGSACARGVHISWYSS
jgi:hypothetical protein